MSFTQIKDLLKEKMSYFEPNEYADVLQKIEVAEKKCYSREPKQEDISKAEEHKIKGNELFKKKDYYEAIYSYTNAIELNPTNPIYYSNRAACYASLNMNENGIEDCEKAVSLDKNYTTAYVRLGDFYAENDKQKASEYYNKALSIEPNNQKAIAKLQNLNSEKKSPGSANPGKFDFNEILKNPEYMKAAQEMMKGKSKEEIMEMLKNMQGAV